MAFWLLEKFKNWKECVLNSIPVSNPIQLLHFVFILLSFLHYLNLKLNFHFNIAAQVIVSRYRHFGKTELVI
jgi:hypothetical protein